MGKPPADVNFTFSDEELETLKPFGDVRAHAMGDPLIDEGDANVDCLITLSGHTSILVETPEGEKRLGWMERGQFAGDIAILTGQASLSRVEMGEAGEVLHISHDNFQRLLVENSHFSDIFVRTLTARRIFSHNASHGAVIVIGDAHDRDVFVARDTLSKHMIAHRWLDPDKDPLAKRIMEAREIAAADLPVVIRGRSRIMSRPDVGELSEAFGLDLVPDNSCTDVVVVGAGPAGLAASVYAASEGLTVVTLDSDGPGGQAGTSSKIENYLGFPMGVSGRELASRASIQAQKFGARIASPASAVDLARDGDNYCISLKDGRRLKARAVVIATGAQYSRLPIENLERFEGRGIYYGATPMEAQLCGGQDVCIVGAGNSAGQGAVFLSQTARNVHVLFRRPNIRDTMSEYLVRRLEETPNIHLHPETEIGTLHGTGSEDQLTDRLTRLSLRHRATKEVSEHDIGFVFLFIGAQPFTDWLPQHMSCDEKGFVKTGPDLSNLDLVRAGWTLDRMPTRYETSWPRVYAVGDVRIGSVKRVASSVGEGSVVVSDIHKALAETTPSGS
ncbi:FAD-dependent oxidoreductase [Henriciella algicola]|uniref:Thioredoxin reductase n=1 Tax=Henriciella algicola TaxID=1608422 RepID=A0A399RTM7_9PROT|nr:FAD-dependent oxidoreductase [Henriciella algicola]RIJ33232.1 FAD-binding protein [Henriciella algicola]